MNIFDKFTNLFAKNAETTHNYTDSGVAIQSFGRYFAGIMDMRMHDNYKICEDYVNEPLNIKNVSPFSISGIADPYLAKYANADRTNTRVKADIRKNFDEICQNAHCDYFVLDNSSALVGLTEINTQLYSLMGKEKTDFMDDYYNNNPEIKANYIHPEQLGFNKQLKSQYDKFIATILQHYDKSRIILIRSHIALFDFGVKAKKVVRTSRSVASQQFIQQLDEYFIKKTQCNVIDTAMQFFSYKFASSKWALKAALEQDTISVIEGNYKQTKHIGGEISAYIADGGTDINILEKLLKSQKNLCNYDDILAIFWLQQENLPNLDNLNNLDNIIKAIKAPNHTQDLFNKNLAALHNYEYNTINLDSITHQQKTIISLGNNYFLELSEKGMSIFDNLPKSWNYGEFIENGYICDISNIYPALESWATYFERGRRKCTEPFILEFTNIEQFEESLYFMDYADILENENYIIKLKSDLLPQFANYQPKVDAQFLFDEKTRVIKLITGLGDQIYTALWHMDFCDKNGLELYFNDFRFDWIFMFNGMEVQKVTPPWVNERRFSKIFSRRLRWALFNFKLPHKQEFVSNVLPEEYFFHLGLSELYVLLFPITRPRWRNYTEAVYNRMRIVPGFLGIFSESVLAYENMLTNKIPTRPIMAITNMVNPTHLTKEMFDKYIIFPQISENDTKNYKISQLAKTADLIAIHLRRGDHLIGRFFSEEKDNADYRKGINLLSTHEYFTKYTNKHLLVFSDEMDYARKNAEKFGFGLFGKNITYVDWNHHHNSYKDMQLISMCKVIIMGIGKFALSGRQASKTCEYLINVMADEITAADGTITKI
ncbi:MAG: alpha-1,2-fucosyltransferase [Defluviitaleaceae bacterium]|nr:alpha-1,2-fucosyltransferase [Defluviitaleaceae bacterium]